MQESWTYLIQHAFLFKTCKEYLLTIIFLFYYGTISFHRVQNLGVWGFRGLEFRGSWV